MNRETFDWIEYKVKQGNSLEEILCNPAINSVLTDSEYRALAVEYVSNAKQVNKKTEKKILNDLLEFSVE